MNSQNAFSFIESLLSRDIEIALHGEKLRIIPASSLTNEDRQFIKANRDALIALVRGAPPTLADLNEVGRLAYASLIESGWPENALAVALDIQKGNRDAEALEALLTDGVDWGGEADEGVLIAVLEGRE